MGCRPISRVRVRVRRLRQVALVALPLLVILVPAPAGAQLGAIEALSRRVSDLSFYGTTGGLLPDSPELEGGALGLASWGVELLFEIGGVEKPLAAPPQPADSVALRWTEMRVVRDGDGADTTYFYEILPQKPVVPTETIWTFELGIGYGQVVGFQSEDPALDLRGAIRELPAVSLYATHEPVGGYLGLRSGFMRLYGLQAIGPEGNTWAGSAESFLAAALIGKAVEVAGLVLFTEAAYSLRYFPSVQWTGGALAPAIPRDLNLSGWSVGGGIQFGIGQ